MIAWQHCDLRFGSLSKLTCEGHSSPAKWLSTCELEAWNTFRSSERKRTFLGGRVLAKQLLLDCCPDVQRTDPQEITISCKSRVSDRDRPVVYLNDRPISYSISISHSGASVLVAGTATRNCSIGVDLVCDRPLTSSFVRSWLTPAEQNLLQENSRLGALELWALKESIYKACHAGEGFSPRRIELSRHEDVWSASYRDRPLHESCSLATWRIRDEIAALALYHSDVAVSCPPRSACNEIDRSSRIHQDSPPIACKTFSSKPKSSTLVSLETH